MLEICLTTDTARCTGMSKRDTHHSLQSNKITLYNVCSVHRGMFSTLGVFSTSGDIMSTLGGYHEYIEGYHDECVGIP